MKQNLSWGLCRRWKMRKIFRAPDYAPIVAMRGGIGLGTMKSRVMRDRLQYLKRTKEGYSNLSAKDFGRGRRWRGVFRLGGVGEIQRRSVLKRMWDKRRYREEG